MAKVLLQNAWYSPRGTYYPASRVEPVEIPDDLVKFIPSSAQVYDAGKKVVPASAVPMMNVPVRGLRLVTEADREDPKPQVVDPNAVSLPPEAQASVDAVNALAEAHAAAEVPSAVTSGKPKLKK